MNKIINKNKTIFIIILISFFQIFIFANTSYSETNNIEIIKEINKLKTELSNDKQKNIYVEIEIGKLHFNIKEFKESKLYLEKNKNYMKNDAYALRLLCMTYLETDELDKLQIFINDYYNDIINDDGKNREKLTQQFDFYKKILLIKNSNNYDKKLEKQLLGDIYHSKGLIYYFFSLKKNAIEYYTLAIAHNPNKISYYNNRSIAYDYWFEPEKIKNDLSKIIELDKNNTIALSNLEKINKRIEEKNEYERKEERDKPIVNINSAIESETKDRIKELISEAKNLRESARYTEAIDKVDNAIKIIIKTYGNKSIYLSEPLIVKSIIYCEKGEFDKSDLSISEYRKISEYLNEDSIPVESIQALSLLYYNIGNIDQSIKMIKQLITDQEKFDSNNYPAIFKSKHLLANYLISNNENNEAQLILENLAKEQSSIMGEEDCLLGGVLSDLGLSFLESNKDKEAENSLNKSNEIFSICYTEKHPMFVKNLQNISLLQLKRNDFESANKNLLKGLKLLKEMFGDFHPEIVNILNDITFIYINSGKYHDAINSVIESQSISQQLIDQIIKFASEKIKLLFMAKQSQSLSLMFSILIDKYKDDNLIIEKCYDIWINRKGVIFDNQKLFNQILVEKSNKEIQSKLDELKNVRIELTKEVFNFNLSQNNSSVEKIKNLTERKLILDSELNRISNDYKVINDSDKLDKNRILSKLNENTALIDFVYTKIYDFNNIISYRNSGEYHYIAFVVTKKNGVKIVDLGNAQKIDKLNYDLKESFEKNKNNPYSINAYNESSVNTEKLYDLIFKPIKDLLPNINNIYISPDNLLNTLPFEILKNGDKFLIDDYTFTYLTSSKELFLSSDVKTTNDGKIVLIGNPDFNYKDLKKIKISEATRSSFIEGIKEPFESLKGTEVEIDAIEKLFDKKITVKYTKNQANEKILLSLKSPKILHIATHGFYLNDKLEDTNSVDTNYKTRDFFTKERKYLNNKTLYHFDNPLVKSGIVLSGANNIVSGKNNSNGEGIITAEKISSLKLKGTELVVLSACNTGLGEIKTGEGVFGLRRAFLIAGAKSILTSLWPVSDNETKDLMVEFYINYKKNDLDLSNSLKNSSLKIYRNIKEQYGYSNPYFWGPFVLTKSF